ncbi:hypothetical protein [Bradyrhizobium barranii]
MAKIAPPTMSVPMVYGKEQTKAVLLRLPLDVKTWVEEQSRRSLASQNSEIIRCLRAAMKAEQQLTENS